MGEVYALRIETLLAFSAIAASRARRRPARACRPRDAVAARNGQRLVQSSVSIAFWSSQDSNLALPARRRLAKPSPQRATTHPDSRLCWRSLRPRRRIQTRLARSEIGAHMPSPQTALAIRARIRCDTVAVVLSSPLLMMPLRGAQPVNRVDRVVAVGQQASPRRPQGDQTNALHGLNNPHTRTPPPADNKLGIIGFPSHDAAIPSKSSHSRSTCDSAARS